MTLLSMMALELTGDDSTAIGKATSSSYTPVAGDIGKHLVAVVRYMDRTEDEDNVPDNQDYTDSTADTYAVRFNNMATSAVTAPVIDDPANAQPDVRGRQHGGKVRGGRL